MFSTEQRLLSSASMRFMVIVLLALPAFAQAQAITVSIISLGNRPGAQITLPALSLITANPIGLTECNATTMIHLRFTGVDITRSNLQFFSGSSACSDPTMRTSTVTTACTPLQVPAQPIQMLPQVDVTVPISNIVPCGTLDAAAPTVWVLALTNPSDATSGAGQQVSFPFAHDLQAPVAPTNVSTGAGDPAVTITWSSSETRATYRVYADPSGCDSTGTP